MYKVLSLLLCLVWISNLSCIKAWHHVQQGLDYYENEDYSNYNDFVRILTNRGNSRSLITPSNESLILEVGDNYTLRCESQEPVVWWHFQNVPKITHNLTKNSNYAYRIEIKLENVTVDYVGTYFCIRAILEPKDNWTKKLLIKAVGLKSASSIHVYVNDTKHLLAPTNHIIFNGRRYDARVPCKPTMPDTELLLKINGKTFSSINSDYSSNEGFLVEILSFNDTGDYICVPKIPSPDNHEESIIIKVRYDNDKFISDGLNIPVINSNSQGYVNGDASFKLVCDLTVPVGAVYQMRWTLPNEWNKSRMTIQNETFYSNDHTQQVVRSLLTVNETNFHDTGVYVCIVVDSNNHVQNTSYQMDVIKFDAPTIKMWVPFNRKVFQEHAGNDIILTVYYEHFPYLKLRWYMLKGNELREINGKINTSTNNCKTTLKIHNAQLDNSGIYILKASFYELEDKYLEFNVSVISGPVVSMDNVNVVPGSKAHVNCIVKSFPTADVTLYFKPCKLEAKVLKCEMPTKILSSENNTRPGNLSVEFVHEFVFTPKEPGIITCAARNKVKEDETKAHVYLGDIDKHISIYGLDKNRKIAREDRVSFTCAALRYFFEDLEWYFNGNKILDSDDIKVEINHTEYTLKTTLTIRSIDETHNGIYECRDAETSHAHHISRVSIKVLVHNPVAPFWKDTNLNAKSKIKLYLGDPLLLECKSQAIPRATVRWYQDEIELHKSNSTQILEEGTKLLISHLYPENEGVYKCVVENRLGSIKKSVKVTIANIPRVNNLWISLGSIFIGVLTVLSAGLAIRFLQDRKRFRELKAAGLDKFEEGDIDQLNPELTLDEQAEFLPYDRGFEFPRDKLKLGSQLDAGAFGVVLMGEAEGIRSTEPVTKVAVKMVQRTADAEMVKALVSELKIMVHLGQHLNVVNLLGAITKNIAKRELMVIVEYCRFGNVQNFLLRNRKCFIDQINPTNNKIDPSINTQRIYENIELHCDKNAMTVNTSDLVSWAFQVARGMDYLSSRKVLHGDLAARNILLCEDNIVKICDFGLARSMCRGATYTRFEGGKLPIKWLALESLRDNVFSTYSDVWSFGILLWELFSLAEAPYPGIQLNQEFFNNLNEGYRMEKPTYANHELYEIMLDCWRKIPRSRPLFNVLERRLSNLLEEKVLSHYVSLNEPYMRYMRICEEYMKYRPSDNLSTLRSLNKFVPDMPHYVNTDISLDMHKGKPIKGYLKMEPKKINVSALPSNTKKIEPFEKYNERRSVYAAEASEEMPMLDEAFISEQVLRLSINDYQNYVLSTSRSDAFSNPNYHSLTLVSVLIEPKISD